MPELSLLPFVIAGNRLAVPVDCVQRVLPSLLCSPLPGAPATVRGLVRIGDRLLPVVDLARRFGWESPAQSLWQPFVWLRTSRRELILSVEAVEAVLNYEPGAVVTVPDPSLPSGLLRGAVRTSDGFLLIQDIEQLLSLDDEQALSAALSTHGEPPA